MTKWNIKDPTGEVIATATKRSTTVVGSYRLGPRDYDKGIQCEPLEQKGYTVERLPDPEPTPPAVSEVKAEAGRRIEKAFPLHHQRNTLAEMLASMRDHGLDPTEWAGSSRSRYEAANTLWQWTKRVRSASDDIEQMDPIPADFRDDKYWPSR